MNPFFSIRTASHAHFGLRQWPSRGVLVTYPGTGRVGFGFRNAHRTRWIFVGRGGLNFLGW